MNIANLRWDTRNKLALTYLVIIMVLSISFSVVFYNESTREAGSGFRQQALELRDNLYFTPSTTIDRIRDKGIDQFRANLLWRLTMLNVGMLAAGTAVSLYLARRSLEPMEAAIERQSRFTSDAAHELRTPLTAMKTEIEVALRASKLSTVDTKELLKSNLEEVGKLETLTDALLRLAKNGDQPDVSLWKPTKITDVIAAAAERVRLQADKRHITLKLPAPSRTSLKADFDQLVELFVILFDNAVKYGRDNTEVAVQAHLDNDTIIVSVVDQGIGIANKDLPHIFERFYRADQSRTKTHISGYGLGLSVAEAIVHTHGGTISAESVQGSSTTFTVRLPKEVDERSKITD
jgi:signal transduction histidine kinase